MGLFSSLRSGAVKSGSARSQLVIDGRTLDVTLNFNARAKRIILRIDKSGGGLVLTVPPGTSMAQAMDFAASQAGWIKARLAETGRNVSFAPGETIPVRGVDHVICHSDKRRTPVWQANCDDTGAVLFVSGQEAHHARRITDWLKKQARADLNSAANTYAGAMGRQVRKISIRDTASRWGSCSSSGALSFSWRLIMAPPFVADYVAAHEVAHLVHMNHSRDFWSLVEQHCPHSKRAKTWLKQNGRQLHLYGG